MSNIRENIEEMIEESYLLGLSEREIKADLERFVDTCGRVIRENVRDRKKMQELVEKLARARALSLIENQQVPQGEGVFPEQGIARSSRENFAEKVARNKRTILRTIGECDRKLVELIEQERFPVQASEYVDQPSILVGEGSGSRARNILLKTCYVVTLLFILLLVYLVLLQNV